MLQDTILTVAPVIDTLQASTDSLITAVGTQVGTQVSALLALVLGVVTKFVVDLAKRGLTILDTAPPLVKALVATAFAQLAMWVTTKTGLVVDPNISTLETTVAGLTVALSAMGVHAVSKITTKK